MTARNGSVEEEIRNIVRGGEDVQNGWSDRKIVQEASQRAGYGAPDNTAADQLEAVVVTVRSESDNDGQTLPPVMGDGHP